MTHSDRRRQHWNLDLPGHAGDNNDWRPSRLPVSVQMFYCSSEADTSQSLVLNSYITEVVEPSQRTGVFGKLQGYVMFGAAFGFLRGSAVYLLKCPI